VPAPLASSGRAGWALGTFHHKWFDGSGDIALWANAELHRLAYSGIRDSSYPGSGKLRA
jgi:hypothetical protein